MDYQHFIIALSAAVAVYRYNEFSSKLHVKDTKNFELSKEYDFIVVGAGSAGCVVANRLTEINDWKVLLLEAGGEETIESQTPFLAYKVWESNLDWNYTTTEQNGCWANNGGTCKWPRGQVMGGSSSINSQIYLRGNKKDYDDWAEQGNQGWSYEDVLPYFIKSEDNSALFKDEGFHGTGGYQPVTSIPYYTNLSRAFLQAGEEMGYEIVDLNGEEKVGFMHVQYTGKNGKRYSTNQAFLQPIRHRRNLIVAKNAFVTKILFEGERATGVEFSRDGEKLEVMATKEVIISGGTINSPQLLMLSGIGPNEHLESFNIPVIADLPVGLNLHDHLNTGLRFTVDPPVAPLEYMILSEESIMEFAKLSTGLLTSPTLNEALGCIDTKGLPNSTYPNLEITFNSFVADIKENLSSWGAMSSNSKPKSRGKITLNSTDPFKKPIIDPNYLFENDDMEIALEGVKFAYNLSQTAALQKYNSKLYIPFYSMCSDMHVPSDEFFRCVIKKYSSTSFHPVGSCKMGPNREDSVVDSRLKVHGFKNLRIVDASIMPFIPSSNTNAPTIMIGEKAADIIKEDFKMLKQ